MIDDKEIPEGEPSELRPQRPRTFLLRIARALRAQDWGAVLIEVVIVVVGVVIGFQVTAWGQSRADAATERTYLRQLTADLKETLRLTSEVDSLSVRGDRATGRSVRMFYMPEAPPADSIILWHVQSASLSIVTPLLGTAEALISSGDLGLIRNDTLRSKITAYVTRSRQLIEDQALYHSEWRRSLNDMMIRIGYHQALDVWVPPALHDSMATTFPAWPGVVGPRRDPFALDVGDLLGDRDALTLINRILQNRLAATGNRKSVESSASDLLRSVESELAR